MARRRRWGREQIEASLADLGDLTSRLNGGSKTPGQELGPSPQAAVRKPSPVEEQLEGLAELAAELDLGLPGTGPARPAGAGSGATNRTPPPTGDGNGSATPAAPAPEGRVASESQANPPVALGGPVDLNGPPAPADRAASPPRTLSEPAPGVLILARPGAASREVRGRSWSLAAAMEPLPPLAPPAPPPRQVAPPELVGDPEQFDGSGGRRLGVWLTLAVVAALLIAAAVAAVLLLAHQTDRPPARPPTHPTPTTAPTAFGIDRLRTVSAAASDPFAAPTVTSFAEGNASVVVDVTYHGASPGTPLGINLARVSAPGQPVTPVLDTSYILSPTPTGEGHNAIVLATPLTPGHYLLRASYAGQPAFADEFDVVPAAPPPPSPTPGRH